jgi:hypothetical protein
MSLREKIRFDPVYSMSPGSTVRAPAPFTRHLFSLEISELLIEIEPR